MDFIERESQGLAAQRKEPTDFSEWLRRNEELRVRLIHSLGLARLPGRSGMNARTVGTISKGSYTIEKLIIETLPDFQASAHLYLPAELAIPAPTVLCVPGHWMENGKLEPDQQRFCANLARLGFIALIYDPIGQGERLGSWLDHGHLAPLLVGVSQEGMMVWESQCMLDYLASRPEVDQGRIGMVGASGGGLNTFYTCAVDERVRSCIMICYITTFFEMMVAERDRNWEDGVDLCNQVPQVMAYAEMSDILGLIAPRPLCIIAATQDWMAPIAGARRVFASLRQLYALHDASGQVNLVEIEAEHGFSQPIRQAALNWLASSLQNQADRGACDEVEPDLLASPYPPALTYIAPPDPADLQLLRNRDSNTTDSPGFCFPPGNCPPPGPAITLLARMLADNLPPRSGLPVVAISLRQQISKVLGPFPPPGPLKDRLLKQTLYQGLFAERILFESEPGITLPAIFLAPASWRGWIPLVLYVDEWGKICGLENGAIDAFLAAGFSVLAVDVRGTGETAASDFEAATNTLMTDRPLFGQRVWDVLRSVDLIWNRVFVGLQIDKGRIACAGRGLGGLLALYAAALDERIAACITWQSPISYQHLLVEQPGLPASAYLFDVLNHFDLPDLMALVAAQQRLLVAEPVDGKRKFLPALWVEENLHTFEQTIAPTVAAESGERNLPLAVEFEYSADPGKFARWLQNQFGNSSRADAIQSNRNR